MRFIKIGAFLAVATVLAGCEGQSQTERALTGALVGAQVGLSGIPSRFIKEMENGAELVKLSKSLAGLAQ